MKCTVMWHTDRVVVEQMYEMYCNVAHRVVVEQMYEMYCNVAHE